jgi:hypothetical protein
MRLFVLSAVLWLFGIFCHTTAARPSNGVFWVTNGIVAILFALGHIPAAMATIPITSATLTYLLSLNGIAALLFGYLFRAYGLEAAMVAHFVADVILHVIAPMLLKVVH